MEKAYFKAIYRVEDPEGITEGLLRRMMEMELMRVYNIYADKLNSGIIDDLNKEFQEKYPTYFKDNEGKEWYDLHEYNKFMADGYQRLVVDKFNKTNISSVLDFYVDPTEVQLVGCLKGNRDITIDFVLERVEI